MEQFIPIAITLGIVGVGLGLGYWFEKKRTEAMAAWAGTRGWAFDADKQSLIDELGGFKLFQKGRSRRMKNCATGHKDGVDVRVADFQYTTGSGRNSQTHRHTIAVVPTGLSGDVHFFCRRQLALFDTLGKLFGGQDVNFDEDPAFSKAYVLQTNVAEARLRAFMNPRLRARLTELADKNIVLEVSGDTLVLHRGTRLKVEQVDELIDLAVGLRRLWS